MLDGDHPATRAGVRELQATLGSSSKPLVLWLGAGTSAWAGLPTWQKLAEIAVSEFKRYEPSADSAKLRTLSHPPALFGYLRDLNPQRFNSLLTKALTTPATSSVFHRFGRLLKELSPLQIVTTNFDDVLQSALPSDLITIQRSDLEAAVRQLSGSGQFLLKLHGTIGAIESCVVTENDYRTLVADHSYLHFLDSLFTQSHVLFLGTSLSDEYVIKALAEAQDLRRLFGDGPHFLIGSTSASLPTSVRQLQISQRPFSDYRATLHVLDLVKEASKPTRRTARNDSATSATQSAYFVSDFLPLGTITTSNTLLTSDDGKQNHEVILGMGFVDEEVPGLRYTAVEDLVVGLLCFDLVFAPLGAISKLHTILGSDRFWRLIDSEAVRFLWMTHDHAVVYPPDTSIGELTHIRLVTEQKQDLTLGDALRRQLHPNPGHEDIFPRLVSKLEKCCHEVPEQDFSAAAQVAGGSILSGKLRGLLGFSDAFQVSRIPRWNVFGLLRLAHVALAGVICHRFGLRAAKLQFGTEVLASATYGLIAERDTASEVASYVVTGRFSGHFADEFEKNPDLLNYLLLYRESPEAIALRKEVGDMLAGDAGAEFVAALNAGLKRFVSTGTLEKARHKFSMIMPRVVLANQKGALASLVQDESRGDAWMKAWRRRSSLALRKVLASRGLTGADKCPCDSGELIRDCCGLALDVNI